MGTTFQMKDMHRVLLDLLQFFKEFCESNNLRFFLAYGTCIGAVRHHGFIPWDDDVDLLMPPDDFDRLLTLWPNLTSKGKYTLCNTSDSYYDRHLALTIRDDSTTYIRSADVDLDTNHGIMIEIGRYMYYPLGKIQQAKQTFYSVLYQVYRAQRKPNNGKKFVKIVSGLMLTLVPNNQLRYRIWSYAERQVFSLPVNKSGYIRCLGSLAALKRLFPESVFNEQIWVPFENLVMPIPSDYDTYLSLIYNDYMTPPTVENRTGHEALFVDTQTPYHQYRGIKYYKQ